MTTTTLSADDINQIWRQLDHDAMENKNSPEATIRLRKSYDKWDAGSQSIARRVFGQWLESDNSRKRFDALVMIDDLSIVEVIKDLKSFQTKLESQSGPEARFELETVNEIIERLEIT